MVDKQTSVRYIKCKLVKGCGFLKVVKYKKARQGKYKVELDDGRVLVLYEEAILKYQLLIKKEIDEELMILIDRYNQECDVYYVALNRLNRRTQSVYDLREYLIHKEYPEDLIEKAIHKLIEQGYLNDRIFARSYIHSQMITTSKGPYRLEKELLEKKIDSTIIHEEIEIYSREEQLQKIKKIVEKAIKTNHTRGGNVLKQKIFQDLKILGHDISLITGVLNQYSFTTDQEVSRREYEKLYRKYSRKYQGIDLSNKIREKMYQKGLKFDNIS